MCTPAKTWLLLVLSSIFIFLGSAFSQVIPLPHAYSHNDYCHKRPLFDALNNGFTHIEADIWLRHSSLVVAHTLPMLKKHNTLESLYLQPLYDRFMKNKDGAPTSMDTIVLMIDIKSHADRTYRALTKLIVRYAPILSSCDNGKVVLRNLTLVLTGHRPVKLLNLEKNRRVFVDNDLRRIFADPQFPSMYTTASCKYSELLKWKGKGLIPVNEEKRLNRLVSKAHALGEEVRLWGSPENERVWAQLRHCGVDLINTDNLKALRQFFLDGETVN